MEKSNRFVNGFVIWLGIFQIWLTFWLVANIVMAKPWYIVLLYPLLIAVNILNFRAVFPYCKWHRPYMLWRMHHVATHITISLPGPRLMWIFPLAWGFNMRLSDNVIRMKHLGPFVYVYWNPKEVEVEIALEHSQKSGPDQS